MDMYEKPVAEVIDFAAERIMDDTGMGDSFSMGEGNEGRD